MFFQELTSSHPSWTTQRFDDNDDSNDNDGNDDNDDDIIKIDDPLG